MSSLGELIGTGIGVGILSEVGHWFRDRRNNSGQVKNSPSTEMWEEGRDYRRVIREDNARLEQTVAGLSDELNGVKLELLAMKEELGRQHLKAGQVELYQATNERLMDEIKNLRSDNESLRVTITDLRGRLP